LSFNSQMSGLLLLTASCAGVAAAQANMPAVVTIEQAVAEAVQNNPGLQAERLGIAVAETGVITAGLRPNPVLSYSNGYLDWLGTRANPDNNAAPTETALRVDLPIERGHKRDLRLENAGFGRTIAEAKLADSIRRLRLDVTLACIDVMEAKARLALANDNLRSLDGIVRLNQVRLDGGAIAPVELTRSRVAMLQFRANVTTAELGLATARTKLQTLLGRRGNSNLVDVAGEMKVPLPAQVPNLQQIQATALSARPDLQALQLDQTRSQAELRLQLAQGKIDYTVGMEYRRQQGVNGHGNSLGLFFSAPLPVYNRNQGEIARVRAAQVQGRQSLDALEAQINGEVSTAYQEFDSARALVAEIERNLLKPSEEARTTTAYVYQAGASSLTDVLDAQRAFNETMSAYYGAEAAYRRAAIQLSSVVGQEVIP
jgi:cobalt-zinc-cadmium efflux system outer membrane protein